MKSNWQVWVECASGRAWRLMKPTIYGGIEPPDWMNKYNQIPPESVGYFDWRTGAIWIKDGTDCWFVRFHEYGHWFFWRLHHVADALWELPWWGLSIRSLFIKKIQGDDNGIAQ